ncbi:hypothetical protein LCGC14_2120070, partial [marine sediment metagenome]
MPIPGIFPPSRERGINFDWEDVAIDGSGLVGFEIFEDQSGNPTLTRLSNFPLYSTV